MDKTCTLNLIGISGNPCDCYTDDLEDITPEAPEWYKQSTSGLFLDELETEGLISMRAADGTLRCDKTLGEFYKESLAIALKRSIDDANIMIAQTFKTKRDGFDGKIGGTKFNRFAAIPNAVIAGVMLSPNAFIDGIFRLTKLTITSSVTREDLTISIWRVFRHIDDDFGPVQVASIEDLTTVASRSTIKNFSGTDVIELPMEVDGEEVDYLFIYELEDNEQLANTSTSCGCGKKERLFNEYATFHGIVIDDTAENFDEYKSVPYSNGIALEGEFKCDSEAIICRMFERSPQFKKVFAYAVRYLAAALVNERVIKSPEISRWNMINFEDIKATSLNFRGEYAERMRWISQNTDASVNDCYQCSKNSGLQMGMTKISHHGSR